MKIEYDFYTHQTVNSLLSLQLFTKIIAKKLGSTAIECQEGKKENCGFILLKIHIYGISLYEPYEPLCLTQLRLLYKNYDSESGSCSVSRTMPYNHRMSLNGLGWKGLSGLFSYSPLAMDAINKQPITVY